MSHAADRSVLPPVSVEQLAVSSLAGRKSCGSAGWMKQAARSFFLLLRWNMLSLHSYCTDVATSLRPLCSSAAVKG